MHASFPIFTASQPFHFTRFLKIKMLIWSLLFLSFLMDFRFTILLLWLLLLKIIKIIKKEKRRTRMPWPSSETRRSLRPPSLTETEMEVEAASREFSTSSLTAAEGRWMTSPAAILFTTDASSLLIRGGDEGCCWCGDGDGGGDDESGDDAICVLSKKGRQRIRRGFWVQGFWRLFVCWEFGIELLHLLLFLFFLLTSNCKNKFICHTQINNLTTFTY